MTISGVLGYLQGLFSRAFWFGSFLPIAIFGVINLVLVSVVFPGVIVWTDWLKVTSDSWTALPLAILGLLVLTYAISPLVKVLHGLLDGSLLPDFIHNWLREQRAGEMRALRRQLNAQRDLFVECKQLADTGIPAMAAARAKGAQTDNATLSQGFDQVEQEIKDFESQLAEGKTIKVSALEDTTKKIQDELEHVNAGKAEVKRLSDLQRRALTIIWDARRDAGYRFITLTTRWRGLALNEPRATRIGDARANVQRYTSDVYDADFDFIWPRVQSILPKDSPLIDRILAAQAQVDFSTLSLALVAVLALTWGPLFAIYATSPYPLLIMGAALPLVAFVLYELLFASEIAFGEVVKLVIDRHRLDLLTTLFKQPLPATLETERQMWQTLSLIDKGLRGRPLAYRHAQAPQ